MRLLHPFAKRFIAGYNFKSAQPIIKNLTEKGYQVSIDYLGELSKTKEDCDKAANQYYEIMEFYKDSPLDISIKPSQLGLLFNPLICCNYLEKISSKAKEYGHTIRLDMEDSRVTSTTINIAISLNKKFRNVGVALQANLFRTKKDLMRLIEEGVSVRLVKGAYKEDKDIALQKEYDIGASFFDYAATMRAYAANKPAIATHDEELLEDIQDMIPNIQKFEFEFLYGVRRDLQKDLKDKGYNVRVYVPFGEDWMPYCLRRLKEWKNLKFVIKNIVKEWFK